MTKKFFIFLCALSVFALPSLAIDFCWKDSYDRGAGKVPETCQPTQDKIGLLCYTKCPEGTARFAFDCQSVCPSTFSDQGLYCRLSEYTRIAYTMQFSDGFNTKAALKRCELDHGVGNCEKVGAIYYPKCKSGFSAFGCCICRPNPPNCASYNLLQGPDSLTCAKKIITGQGSAAICNAEEESCYGLCYSFCKAGYHGVGPVCWSVVPDGWIECGMGAAKNSADCAAVIVNQISSVGSLALDIVNVGSESTMDRSTKLSKIKLLADKIQSIYQASPDGYAEKAKNAIQAIISSLAEAGSNESSWNNLLSNAALLASLFDASESSVYPKCSS